MTYFMQITLYKSRSRKFAGSQWNLVWGSNILSAKSQISRNYLKSLGLNFNQQGIYFHGNFLSFPWRQFRIFLPKKFVWARTLQNFHFLLIPDFFEASQLNPIVSNFPFVFLILSFVLGCSKHGAAVSNSEETSQIAAIGLTPQAIRAKPG